MGCGENQFSNDLSLSAALRKLLCLVRSISVLFKILKYPGSSPLGIKNIESPLSV